MSSIKNIETARAFMHFIMDYNALIKRHPIEGNPFRVHSHSFSMLYVLREYRGQPITMTKFAEEMGVTKQQLTKLVNDLEEMGFVARSHNLENRRQIYIEITDEGLSCLEKMMGEIAHAIMSVVCDFDDADKDEIIAAAETLSAHFKRDAENCRLRGKNTAPKDE